MSAMWHDINTNTATETLRNKSARRPATRPRSTSYSTPMIPLLFRHNIEQLTKTLGILETEAGHYGVRLNKDKCEFLGMNNAITPRYGSGGVKVKRVLHAKYLGVILSADGTADEEMKQRIRQTMATWKR